MRDAANVIGASTEDQDPRSGAGGPVSRRGLLRRSLSTAAAAAAGAVSASALGGGIATRATNGDPVTVGNLNTGTSATTVRNMQVATDAVALKGIVAMAGAGGSTAGLWGQSNATHGNGVFGIAVSGNSKGVWGRSQDGRGVNGEATGTTGTNFGVYGESKSNQGQGVHGEASATTGLNYGVVGISKSSSGRGVYGKGDGAGVVGSSAAYGVYGEGGSAGLYGLSPKVGVRGSGDTGVLGEGAIVGVSGKGSDQGVYGKATRASGVSFGLYGEAASPAGLGVYGKGSAQGVYGISTTPTGTGVMGVVTSASTDAIAVLGHAEKAPGYAGLFFGTVYVQGVLAGTNKAFLIDHPLDPANRTIMHSCVEAPEMLNVYRGTVTPRRTRTSHGSHAPVLRCPQRRLRVPAHSHRRAGSGPPCGPQAPAHQLRDRWRRPGPGSVLDRDRRPSGRMGKSEPVARRSSQEAQGPGQVPEPRGVRQAEVGGRPPCSGDQSRSHRAPTSPASRRLSLSAARRHPGSVAAPAYICLAIPLLPSHARRVPHAEGTLGSSAA